MKQLKIGWKHLAPPLLTKLICGERNGTRPAVRAVETDKEVRLSIVEDMGNI